MEEDHARGVGCPIALLWWRNGADLTASLRFRLCLVCQANCRSSHHLQRGRKGAGSRSAAPGLIYAPHRTVNPSLAPPQAVVSPENKDAVCSQNLCLITHFTLRNSHIMCEIQSHTHIRTHTSEPHQLSAFVPHCRS